MDGVSDLHLPMIHQDLLFLRRYAPLRRLVMDEIRVFVFSRSFSKTLTLNRTRDKTRKLRTVKIPMITTITYFLSTLLKTSLISSAVNLPSSM